VKLILTIQGNAPGMPPRSVVRTAAGTAQDEELRTLVAEADLGRFPEPTMRTGPDRVHYTLIVEDGDLRHSILFDGERTPPQFRGLIDAILKYGKPENNG
jgi:hypothetical protein